MGAFYPGKDLSGISRENTVRYNFKDNERKRRYIKKLNSIEFNRSDDYAWICNDRLFL